MFELFNNKASKWHNFVPFHNINGLRILVYASPIVFRRETTVKAFRFLNDVALRWLSPARPF